MLNWNNTDTLDAYKKMLSLKGQVKINEVLSAERVKSYQSKMAAGLVYNYAAKEVNEQILTVLQQLADEAELTGKFKELYEGEVINRRRRNGGGCAESGSGRGDASRSLSCQRRHAPSPRKTGRGS